MDETKLIGTVFAVSMSGISAVLNENVVIKSMTFDRASRVGQIGS